MTTREKFEGKHSDLTGKILGCFFQIQKELGYGFSEKVYENALVILLKVYDNEFKESLSWFKS